MIKRMTLLSRKEGTSTSDFRAYWAGCHAALALCMEGITSYTQNRVEKILWQRADAQGCFQVDGVVELCFENDEVMSVAQRSAIGTRYIPEDEPNLLRGWSLCVVAVMKDAADRDTFRKTLVSAIEAGGMDAQMAFNWMVRTAKRERLWSEPLAPSVLLSIWFRNTAQAHKAFEADGGLAHAIGGISSRAAAYLIDPLVMK